MRFVPVNCIREGMKLGKNLVGRNGELLLSKRAVIQCSYINKIMELGYNGIYVDDDLSEGIEISDIIDEDLRYKTVKTVKDIFKKTEDFNTYSGESFDNISELLNSIIEDILGSKDVLVNMIDLKVFDDYTFYHSTNVTVLSLIVGAALGLNKIMLNNLGLSAILHDIGKVFIPREILNKTSELTSEEFEIIKTHSEKGYKYLRGKFDIPSMSYIGVLQHHERFDGTGYPGNKIGDQISLFGKIISVTDVYDALTSRRPYRRAMEPSEAIEYIMGGGGTHFDPKITECFTQRIAPYPIGTYVCLSNNTAGIVVENYRDCCLRPKIKIVKQGGKVVEPYIVDLKQDMSALGITILGLEVE